MNLRADAIADTLDIFPEIASPYDVYLHGVFVFTILARYDRGGRMQQMSDVEMVVSQPQITVMPVDADRLTRDHTIRTDDGDVKIFGGGLRNNLGLTRFEVVRR